MMEVMDGFKDVITVENCENYIRYEINNMIKYWDFKYKLWIK